MRMAPRTPKAGSTRVSRTMGGGVGVLEAVAEAEAEREGEADVAVGVRVRLNTVGTTVMNWVRTPFERITVVTVAEAVVREKERGSVEEGVCEVDD